MTYQTRAPRDNDSSHYTHHTYYTHPIILIIAIILIAIIYNISPPNNPTKIHQPNALKPALHLKTPYLPHPHNNLTPSSTNPLPKNKIHIPRPLHLSNLLLTPSLRCHPYHQHTFKQPLGSYNNWLQQIHLNVTWSIPHNILKLVFQIIQSYWINTNYYSRNY